MTDKPFTHIGTPTSDTKRFRMRGKDVLSEIIGVKSFAETFYLLVTGRDLPENHVRTFDACMNGVLRKWFPWYRRDGGKGS